MIHHTLLKTCGLLLIAFIGLSYSDDPPNGRTGAPFDTRCSSCHIDNNPGGYNGIAELIGLPDTVEPGTVYSLQIRASVTAGSPVRAGYQLVVVDNDQINAGDLSVSGSDSDTEFFNGREYLDQREAKFFSGMPVSWNFTWTAPAQAACNTIKFYYIVNFCNGSGDFGDYSIAFVDSVYLNGGPDLMHTVATLQHNNCPEDLAGIAQVSATGGVAPYSYKWSNGATDTSIPGLGTGTYSVTIQDHLGCRQVDSTAILSFDTIPPQLVCPDNFSVCAGDTVHYTLPTLSDNCALGNALPYLWSGLPNHTLFPLGLTTQVFQANDLSGNTAHCSFEILVNAPLEIQLDSILNDSGNAGIGGIYITVEGGSGPPYTYTWKKDGALYASSMQDLNGLHVGEYAVEISDSLGCTAKLSGLWVENTVGTIDLDAEISLIEPYPNPVFQDAFYLRGAEQKALGIVLIDLQGKVASLFSGQDWPGPYYTKGIPDGIYGLKIATAEGKVFIRKLVIMRH